MLWNVLIVDYVGSCRHLCVRIYVTTYKPLQHCITNVHNSVMAVVQQTFRITHAGITCGAVCSSTCQRVR